MATVYAPPEDLPDTPDMLTFRNADNRLDFTALLAAEEAWLNQLSAWCVQNNPKKSPLIGKVVRYPYADGHAVYVVYTTTPLALIHAPIGDAWQLPEWQTRGLRLSDVETHVQRNEELAALFGRPTFKRQP